MQDLGPSTRGLRACQARYPRLFKMQMQLPANAKPFAAARAPRSVARPARAVAVHAHKAVDAAALAGLAAVVAPQAAQASELLSIADASSVTLAVGGGAAIAGLGALLVATDPQNRCASPWRGESSAQLRTQIPRRGGLGGGASSYLDAWRPSAVDPSPGASSACACGMQALQAAGADRRRREGGGEERAHSACRRARGARRTCKDTRAALHRCAHKQVRNYFNTTGFERWRKIYGETDEVNKVQLDIRQGHAQTVDKVLKWVDEEGGVDGITVADAGCGTGERTIHARRATERLRVCSLISSLTTRAARSCALQAAWPSPWRCAAPSSAPVTSARPWPARRSKGAGRRGCGGARGGGACRAALLRELREVCLTHVCQWWWCC